MPLTRFERLLPWSGAVAGVCWIGQGFLQKTSTKDVPGAASVTVIHDHLALNYGSVAMSRGDGDRPALLRHRHAQPAPLG